MKFYGGISLVSIICFAIMCAPFLWFNGLSYGDATRHVVLVEEIIKERSWITWQPYFGYELEYPIIFHVLVSVPFIALNVSPSGFFLIKYLQVISIFISILTAIAVYYLVKDLTGKEDIAFWAFIFTAVFSKFNYWHYMFGGFPYHFEILMAVVSMRLIYRTVKVDWKYIFAAMPCVLITVASHTAGIMDLTGACIALAAYFFYSERVPKMWLVALLVTPALLMLYNPFFDYIIVKLANWFPHAASPSHLLRISMESLYLCTNLLAVPALFLKKPIDAKIRMLSLTWILYYVLLYLIFPWDLVIGMTYLPSAILAAYSLEYAYGKWKRLRVLLPIAGAGVLLLSAFYYPLLRSYYLPGWEQNFLNEEDVLLMECIKTNTNENASFLAADPRVSQWIAPMAERKAPYHSSNNPQMAETVNRYHQIYDAIKRNDTGWAQMTKNAGITHVFAPNEHGIYFRGHTLVCNNSRYSVFDIG